MTDKTGKKLTAGQRRSRENLKPFKKGQSGNPGGGPKKEVCIPAMLREMSAEIDEFDSEKKRTVLQSICKKALEQAIGGDKDARNWIADRMEGKALETVKQVVERGEWDGKQDPIDYLNEQLAK